MIAEQDALDVYMRNMHTKVVIAAIDVRPQQYREESDLLPLVYRRECCICSKIIFLEHHEIETDKPKEYQSMHDVVNTDHLLRCTIYSFRAVPLTWKRMASLIFPGKQLLLMLIETCIGVKCWSLVREYRPESRYPVAR
jgi:hypothetical protein